MPVPGSWLNLGWTETSWLIGTQGKTSCKNCPALLSRKYNARHVLLPNAGNLPTSCVELDDLFKHARVDFIGHLWVREGGWEVKMYFLIFTCLNVRAVHIKVLTDMGMLSFLQALVHFINLYGISATIYCNNAKTFVAVVCGGGSTVQMIGILSWFLAEVWLLSNQVLPYSPFLYLSWRYPDYQNLLPQGGWSWWGALLTIIYDIQRAINNCPPPTYGESTERELELTWFWRIMRILSSC